MTLLHRLLPMRLLLAVLLGSLLVGVQLLQASPLHHHAGHSVLDCSIGHLPSLDTPHTRLPQPVTIPALALAPVEYHEQPLTLRRVAPYQGRAPPLQSR